MERYVRPLEDGEQFGLIGVQPRQQAIECGEAGVAAKDAIEAGTHLAAALCGRRRAIGLEVGIKPPDQRAYALLCVAVQIGEGVELVHQPLCMDPTQRMSANGKLTGIIADDDGVAQEAVGMNAAPQCTLGRDLHRVWSDAHSTDAEAVEMRLPSGLVGKVCPGLRRQLADHGSGEGTATHVAQGRIIDHVVGMSGAQEIEEVQPALAGPRAEPGEAVVSDLCAEAILSGVARASIVHRDPCRRLQAGPQHLTVLDEEVTLAVNQQTHDLALRDADPDGAQLRGQPLHRHLALVILQQYEAA